MTSAAPDSRTGGSDRPPRILVVDDEPSLAELLTMALGHEGWDGDRAPLLHAVGDAGYLIAASDG